MIKAKYRVPLTRKLGKRSRVQTVDQVDPAGTCEDAIEGEVLEPKTLVELPVGTVLLEVYWTGTNERTYKRARISHIVGVDDDGYADVIEVEHLMDWEKDFILVRDRLLEVMGEEISPLSGVPDDLLIEEIKRRDLELVQEGV